MKIIFTFTFLILFNTSCINLSPEEEMIRNTLGKTVNTEMITIVREGDKILSFNELREVYSFVYLVYLEDDCRPCYPKFIMWQDRMDTLQLNDDFTLLFIIKALSYEGFMSNLLKYHSEYNTVKDKYPIFIDRDQKFVDGNEYIPRLVLEKSLLIDKNNTIRLIGNPFASPRISDLFYRICNEKEK